MKPRLELSCCEAARTCAELEWTEGRDMMPPQAEDGWTIVVDFSPDSPHGFDIERGAIKFCPFCGKNLAAHEAET